MNKEYIVALCERLAFPKEATAFFAECAKAVNENAQVLRLMEETLVAFESCGFAREGIDCRFAPMTELCGICEHSLAMLFLLEACQGLEARYAEAGYSEALFVDTMMDLKYKLMECRDMTGDWGNLAAWWYGGFFNMTRFALGRFQFEKREFTKGTYSAGGHNLRNGDVVLNFHIPSSGISLCDEVRFDAYRRAKEFFFPGSKQPVAFVCSTWLLWPDYEDYLPEGSNLKKFRHDFTVLTTERAAFFKNAWRVFGKDANLPPEQLPRKTGQQRAFADYLRDGGPHGTAYGVFLFDGETILR